MSATLVGFCVKVGRALSQRDLASGLASAEVPPRVNQMRALIRSSWLVTFAVVPLAATIAGCVFYWQHGSFAGDFHRAIYPQAQDLVQGRPVFDPPNAPITGNNHLFSVTAVLAATPLTLLRPDVADITMTVLIAVAATVTLGVLSVRDWRVYGLVFLWPPVISALQTGNLTIFIGLAAAFAWRTRQRRLLPGAFVGLAFALKLFPWPLAVWLIATRRYAAALVAAAVGMASVLLILPFGDIGGYFTLVKRNGEAWDRSAYSIYALLGGGGFARAIWLVVAIATLALALRLDDRRSFTFAVAACILFSPIVWVQYFALLLVPLAIARPRLGPIWFLPLVYWFVPFSQETRWQIVLALTVMTTLLAGISVSFTRRRVAPGGLADCRE